MNARRPATAGILAGVFLFAPLLYSFLAGFLSQRRGPTENPEWIIYARVISAAVAFLSPVLVVFVARQVRLQSAEKLRRQGADPELVVFLAGSAWFLAPATISIISFMAGTSAADVYCFSAFSCLAVMIWSWYNRSLFPLHNQVATYTTEGQTLSHEPPSLVRAYTVLLLILSSLAFPFLAVKIIVMTRGVEPGSSVSLNVFLVLFYIFITVGSWIAVFLRARRSRYALAATGLISFAILSWIPLGTAAFVYWIGWVRKRETSSY